jgi:hypothetical protein
MPWRLNAVRAALVLTLLFAIVGGSGVVPAQAVRPNEGPVRQLRMLTDHYRLVTWQFQKAARVKRTPTSFSYRRTSSRAYLTWTVESWTRRAYLAERVAVKAIHRKLAVELPQPPTLRARLYRRIAFNHRLALRLRRIYPGRVTRAFASASVQDAHARLRLWQRRSAAAALAVAEHAVRRAQIASGLLQALMCIHRYEGAWTANTGNGYYGGLQMDLRFMSLYGPEFVDRWGTADNWPAWAQLEAGARASESGRGFTPWPNTSRVCGLQ